MTYRVFAQTALLDPALLVRQATRFFEGALEVLEQPNLDALRLRIASVRRGYSGEFLVQTRLKRAEDDDAAARAEQTGRAGGMAALAGRCTHVWTIDCAAEDAALFNLCAILASIALGPVLPPDESTLFGVRGAMQRVEALTFGGLSR